MKETNVQLTFFSDSPHISQIITGFIMLKNEGLINLEINYAKKLNEYCPSSSIVEVILNEEIKIAYDMLDGYNLDKHKLNKYLSNVDYYFKRSFSPDKHKNLEFASRMYPLGLNYHVTIAGNPIDKLNILENITKPKSLVSKMIKQRKFFNKNFYVEKFEDIPTYNLNNRILFMTRTWNPNGEKGENPDWLTDEVKQQRSEINEMRIKCITLLKKEFGENFYGGISPSEYSFEKFPDYVVDNKITKRRNFMKEVRNSDICIATSGLHDSIGWKLAEYIAASKAVVSERLNYTLTGKFEKNVNYLEFSDAAECVNEVSKLMNNPDLLYSIKNNNFIYYQNFLRPDRLVLNSLNTAIYYSEKQ